MGRALETIRLIRPVNCLLAMAGVWIGAWMTWFHPVYYNPLLASLAAFLTCAGGNSINDYLDISIDRINRPERTLVKGTLSRPDALKVGIGSNVLALVLALTVNQAVTITAVIVISLLLAYNLFLKRVPLAGNVTIALLGGLTFITGGLAVDPTLTWVLPGPLIPAVFALLFHLVREILKDVQDREGDRQAGIRTLPQIIGVQPALLVCLALFLLLVIFTFVPIVTGWFGDVYKVIAVYIVDLPTLALLILIWANPSPKMLNIGSIALKLGMILGLVALVLS